MRGAAAIGAGVLAGLLPGMALGFDWPALTSYGNLNPAWLGYDDGQDSIGSVVDNYNAESRIGLWLDWDLGQSRLRFNAETALGFLESDDLSMAGADPWYDLQPSDIRKLEFTLSGRFGALWLGQGSMATDGVAQSDLTGTALVGMAKYYAVAGGFALRESDGSLSDLLIADVFTALEGTRRLRLRYDTPEWRGMTLSLASGHQAQALDPGDLDSDSYADMALRYAGQLGEVQVAGGLGLSLVRPPGEERQVDGMGSLSLLHAPTGLGVALAAGRQEGGGDYRYLKLGWQGDLVDWGRTNLAAEWYGSDGIGGAGLRGRSVGLMLVQEAPVLATDFYLGWRRYEVTEPGAEYLASASLLVGANWRF